MKQWNPVQATAAVIKMFKTEYLNRLPVLTAPCIYYPVLTT